MPTEPADVRWPRGNQPPSKFNFARAINIGWQNQKPNTDDLLENPMSPRAILDEVTRPPFGPSHAPDESCSPSAESATLRSADKPSGPQEQMLRACITGDVDSVKQILVSAVAHSSAELLTFTEVGNPGGDSALTLAVLFGHVPIVRVLLASNVALDIDCARAGRCRALVASMLMSLTTVDDETRVSRALGLRSPSRMRQQVEMWANLVDAQGTSWRQHGMPGYGELARTLLEAKASPDPLECDASSSPLEIALLYCRSPTLVRLLFKAGATLPRAASHRREKTPPSPNEDETVFKNDPEDDVPQGELLSPFELTRLEPGCLQQLLAAKASPHGSPDARPVALACFGGLRGLSNRCLTHLGTERADAIPEPKIVELLMKAGGR